jgi:uncharacterized protein YqeY
VENNKSMSTLKEKIQTDFVVAMKTKDETTKRTLSSFKAKITEAEKANKNTELTDNEVIKVLNSAIKQRKQSYDEYVKYGRIELANAEMDEIEVLKNYQPKQMDNSEIETAVREIVVEMNGVVTNPQALIGRTIGEFNKKYTGLADIEKVKSIVNKVLLNQ